VPEPKLEALDRISPRTIFTVLTLVAVTYLLVPQLGDVPGMVDRIRQADWAWLPAIVVMSALTYVGAALSIAGSVPPGCARGRHSSPSLPPRSPANWHRPASADWR
jgi:undecaprenyl-diphosphatase